ncbi:MAG: hypothetical protein QNK04_09700 [Myxococcota bacterium]|nr:hypothetical protein [Myxococcota bacterium]
MRFGRVRMLLLLGPILLGLMGGAAARLADTARPGVQQTTAVWELGELDETVFEETADIDALLALVPPEPGDPTGRWVEFGRAVRATDTGTRDRGERLTTPVLVWYAHIAKHEPEAIYRLHDEGVVTESHLGQLLEFGLAPDWHDRIRDADALILTSSEALSSLAVQKGAEHARRRFVDAFFAPRQRKIQLDLEGLRFALPAMTDAEIERVVPHLERGPYRLDPRRLRRLLQSDRLEGAEGALLSLIAEHAYPSRSMSSYFVDGALLGNVEYVDELISDLADNARQPTNFYCAACGLALTSDGLLGSALLRAREREQRLALEHERSAITITAAGERS